jgi:hypothetical protein
MELEQTDATWLDDRLELSFSELARLSGLTEAELRELVGYGALAPTNPTEAEWTFSGEFVVAMRTAGRLRADLELEPQAIALALALIERVRELEAQLSDLRARLPRRFP